MNQLPIHSPTAMIFFCIFAGMAIPYFICCLSIMIARPIKNNESFVIIMGLAGWALGYALFSSPI